MNTNRKRITIGLKKAIHFLYKVPPLRIVKVKSMDNNKITNRSIITTMITTIGS